MLTELKQYDKPSMKEEIESLLAYKTLIRGFGLYNTGIYVPICEQINSVVVPIHNQLKKI